MRAVVQRVSAASVTVEGRKVGTIGPGLLVLLGVARGDTEKDGEYLAEKLAGLRIFEDEEEKMNRSVAQIGAASFWYPSSPCTGMCAMAGGLPSPRRLRRKKPTGSMKTWPRSSGTKD